MLIPISAPLIDNVTDANVVSILQFKVGRTVGGIASIEKGYFARCRWTLIRYASIIGAYHDILAQQVIACLNVHDVAWA